jgi:hypothetical protein
MQKYNEEKLKNVKKVIDVQAYSGGILNRAHDAALSKDDTVVKNVMVESRCKGKSHKMHRGY